MYASIVRTVVPYIVGALVALAARFGIDLPEDALTEVTTPVVATVVAAVYYAVARAAEEYLPDRWQRLGRVMLASSRRPRYSTDEEARQEIRRLSRDEGRRVTIDVTGDEEMRRLIRRMVRGEGQPQPKDVQ